MFKPLNKQEIEIARTEKDRCKQHVIGMVQFWKEQSISPEAMKFIDGTLTGVARVIEEEFQMLYGGGESVPRGLIHGQTNLASARRH